MWYCCGQVLNVAMEERLKRSSSEVHVLKQENQVDSNGEDAGKVGNKRKIYDEDKTSERLHNQKNLQTVKQEDQLEYAKAKMFAVKEENEKLKVLLDSIVKEHQTLQTHIFEIVQQEQATKSTRTTSTENQAEESYDLVFLSLGRSSGNVMNKEKSSNLGKSKESEALREGLSLALDSKFDVSSSCGTETTSSPSLEHADLKEGETKGQWALSNNLKPTKREEDDVALAPQALAKKIRVSVRARCDGPTMNDGCQWRKYGQKISKGNPCPRAYYRCTVGPTCPVRKQVQRCAEDMSILTTSYEGTHNHPLPVSATAMASATSAAACMQMSGSSSSCPTPTMSNNFGNLHSLNFNFSDKYRPTQFYSTTSSFPSLSSHPTITLDLTTPSSSLSSSSLHTPLQFNRYTTTNLNFSSVNSNVYPSYGIDSYNKNLIGSVNHGTQHHGYFPFMPNIKPPPNSQHSFSSENIVAATKAITSDPSFQTALEAAITSIVGSGVDRLNGSQIRGDMRIDNSSRWGESFTVNSTYSSSSINWSGRASGYLNTSPSSSKLQEESLMLLPPPPPLPISSTKNASQSRIEDKKSTP